MSSLSSIKILVLGTAQDGGYPQPGCDESCCNQARKNPSLSRKKTSIAILSGKNCWLVDITPDFCSQLSMIEKHVSGDYCLKGIFITHAHIGHYVGLLELGLEVMNVDKMPVYVMPRMETFLKGNAPFSQLIQLNNIQLKSIQEDVKVDLDEHLSITPIKVSHRNEYSETVGFKIQCTNQSLIYISDIDSWDIDINGLIRNNDFLLLDGTFHGSNELRHRNMKDVPHPLIIDSMHEFSVLEEVDRKKVYFTHLNHTNPVIRMNSPERLELIANGFHVAEDGMEFTL